MKNKIARLLFATMGGFLLCPFFVFAAGDGSVELSFEIDDNTLNGPALLASDLYSFSVASIGDLDDDGVADLIAGAPGDDLGGSYTGTAHIMFMNSDNSVKSTVEINANTMNGPGLGAVDFYGTAAASLGDLDNDGVEDIAVGAYGTDGYGDSGAVHVHFMNANGSVKSTAEIHSSTPNGPSLALDARYGAGIANMGDLDGDGVIDIAVGSYQDDTGGTKRGAVFISYLNTDGSVKSTVEINSDTLNGPTLSDSGYYGFAVANIGDLDNDGVNDLAVGATGLEKVFIHFINANGSVKSTAEIDVNTSNGPLNGYNGRSISSLGDLDNDGVEDIAVGATDDDTGGNNRGAIYIHFMNTDGSIKSSVAINSDTLNGPTLSNDDKYGIAIANMGDVDGNGVVDLAVGAANDDNGGTDKGVIHIHQLAAATLMSSTVVTNTVSNVAESTATGSGEITDIGADNPERFIEWGTVSGTYTDECSAGTDGTGTYSCDIINLTANTTYYVRAKAVNSEGTSYGDEVSFITSPLTDTVIPNPDTSKISDAVTNGYMTVENGTITNTDQIDTQVNVTFQETATQAIFPTGTTIQEQTGGDSSFNFENFTLETQDVTSEQSDSIKAFRLGIPGEKLDFSEDVTVTINLGAAYNGQELDILYQEEGESAWISQGTCTVSNGECTFTTDHATIYTINGVLQSTGAAPLDINVEVQSTLSLDCHDSAGISGDYDVLLGTTANPGLVTAGIPAVGQSTCEASTNDQSGYYLTVVDDNGASNTTLTHIDPNTAAVYEIQDLTQYSFNTPNTINWNAPTTKGLGFSVISFPDTSLTNNQFNGDWTTSGNLCEEGTTADAADYAGIPDTPEAVAAVTQHESGSTTTNICYKVDVPSSQPSGQYTGSVTYTATTDASSYVN